MDGPRTARARARAELTREIKDEARRQLAVDGGAGLSLRAVARELGMVSSAVYRYFPSRDDLLTALITDAYVAVGAAAEAADAACERSDVVGRWFAAGRGIRRWALERPHEYALVYGSPVPGYRAPEATIAAATQPALVLSRIVVDAWESGLLGRSRRSVRDEPVPAGLAADADRLADALMPGVPRSVVLRALMAWTQLFGTISFELFGHFVGVVDERDAFFDHALASMVTFVGLK